MFKKFIERIKAIFTFKPITIKLEPKYTPFQWNLIQKHERYVAEKNSHYIETHVGYWDEEYYRAKTATARGK